MIFSRFQSHRITTPLALTLFSALVFSDLAHAQNAASVDYTTYGYGNARLGWNARETRLTPQNVNAEKFGPRWKTKLDGGVYGSTLVVNDLQIDGRKRRVVFAATERNTVYALDADNGRILWTTRELAEPVSDVEFRGWWSRRINGILSTPVIDTSTRTLYVCGVTRRGLRQQYVVWALDLQTGKVRRNWPQTVRGSYRGAKFIAGEVLQRGALSLVNGWLLVPFGGRGDTPPWRGWVVAINTQNPTAIPSAFSSAPQDDGGGVWSAAGMTADENGHIYGVTGNGEVDIHEGGDHIGQTVFRLSADARGLQFSKKTADYYTPTNFQHLNDQDEDLGGASAMVLPPHTDSSTRNLLFIGGKDGVAYLLNRDNLGGIGGELQKTRLYGVPNAVYHEGIRATSAYFQNEAGRFLFVPGDETGEANKGLTALKLVTSNVTTSNVATSNVATSSLQSSTRSAKNPAQMQQIWTLPTVLERPSSPVVTSNVSQDAIVWLMETRDYPGAVLRAYEPFTGREIYNSDQSPVENRLPAAARFINPVVANGQVFVSTTEGVFCYGLNAPDNALDPASS